MTWEGEDSGADQGSARGSSWRRPGGPHSPPVAVGSGVPWAPTPGGGHGSCPGLPVHHVLGALWLPGCPLPGVRLQLGSPHVQAWGWFPQHLAGLSRQGSCPARQVSHDGCGLSRQLGSLSRQLRQLLGVQGFLWLGFHDPGRVAPTSRSVTERHGSVA